MGLVLLHYQAIRNKLLQVLFLFTRRSVIVKMIGILMVFATLECIYKMNFSLLEQIPDNRKDRRPVVDCHLFGGQSESLCSTNVNSFGNTSRKEASDTSLAISVHSQLQAITNVTTTAQEEKRKSLTDLNITTVLENIRIGGSPFPPTNPHPYKPISLPSDCNFHGNRSKIVILMYSRPGNYYYRKIIRRTWGELKDPNTRLVFLLGFLEDDQYVIEEESDRHRDILQEDFHDSYKNSTLKLIMGYNWAVKHCSKADVILSVNETLQVRSDILFEYIRDLVTLKPSPLFRGDLVPSLPPNKSGFIGNTAVTKAAFSNVNLVSRDVSKKFQIIFPYIKNSDNDINGYLGNVARILRLVKRKILHCEEIPQTPTNRKLLPLVHNATQCKFTTKGHDAAHILVVIWSDPTDTEQRSAIREMWKYTDIGTVRQVFVLGSEDIHQKDVNAESKNYGDIIQVSAVKDKFFDTIKTVSSFAWIVQYCKSTDFVIFLDGNINVDIDMITAFMKKLIKTKNNNNGVFLGHVVDERNPDRRQGSPLYVSEGDYPFDHVPPSVIGSNYVMSFNIVRSFHVVFPFVKYCPNVDLYLGIVASKLMVIPSHDPHFDRRNQTSFFRDNP
ncbi:Beta-1,3-galactosyltransferase brn [Mizuhopecten yessoensis]|uniref:Beta-1,3-galactosyltransferase brn n=1 Tax=Mizuhopecten yessoensis TaxID=6573 RepID=A0A210QK25_MIZYE|nr:Beta-1,3-galactosyltransferase brn [Mizuhopecten yessoensis]